MAEYQNWYQVLRPIGSFTNERSRVEVLKLPDESDIRLKEKIRSMTSGFPRDYSPDTLQSHLSSIFSDKSVSDVQSPSVKEIIMTRNLKKRPDSDTYLLPNVKAFQDQEDEIKSIFWNLLKTVDPECPADIDVEAIRAFLKRRQEALGREKLDDSDVDVFDKYGLGMHAQPLASFSDEEGSKRPRGSGVDSLIAMIDKMVEERTKPIPEGKNMYEKNNRITGKVGFRRDEMNGPREYTDLDEQLGFGDLDKDVDFRKFLVDKKKGRIDSKGNFVPFESEIERRRRLGKGGKEDQKKNRRKKGGKDGDKDSSEEGSSKGRTDGLKAGRPRTASEMMRNLGDTKKSRRYPEWDFPMCNYPKWVHRMYRMDQEKIGQLIKQGMNVPELCPPWTMNALDGVWEAKDASTRGDKPSHLRGSKLEGNESDSSPGAVRVENKKETHDNEGDKRGSQDREGKAFGQNAQIDEDNYRPVDGGLDGGGSKNSFGIGDFLQGYEREMLDLAKLETDSDSGGKRHPGELFDINDMIAEYKNQLQREEDILKASKEKYKITKEVQLRKTKERLEAAKKRMADKDNKRLQDNQIKFEKEQMVMEKKKERIEKGKLSGMSTRGAVPIGKRRERKSRKFKKLIVETEPCSEFKTLPGDPAKDVECMKRFKIILEGQNKITKENEFKEIVKNTSLLKYEKAPPLKTPCERVELPIFVTE